MFRLKTRPLRCAAGICVYRGAPERHEIRIATQLTAAIIETWQPKEFPA
jgi:hypothetical protein